MIYLLIYAVAGFALLISPNAEAQGKTCVYNCTPPPSPPPTGGGGTYYVPAPPRPGPSPAEIAARQRRAAAHAANLRGNAALSRNEFDAAVSHYQQAYNNNSADRVIRRNLNYARALAANARKDYVGALRLYETALHDALGDRGIMASAANTHNLIGNEAFDRRDFAAAIAAYQRALQLNPTDGVIRQNLENAVVQQKQEGEIAAHKAEQLKRDTIISPQIAPLLDQLSAQFSRGGDFDGTTRPQEPIDTSGGASASGRREPLAFASGDLSKPALTPIDASVVDLRDRGSTVHPSTLKPPSPSAPQMPPVPPPLTDEEMMRLLFVSHDRSQWPGPRNLQEPLINPLREPDRYRDFLTKRLSDGQSVEKRIVIEKRIAETEPAAIAKIMRDAQDEINAAALRRRTALARVLTEMIDAAGLSTRDELFERGRLDPELNRQIKQRTEPIFAAEEAVKERVRGDVLIKFIDFVPMEFGPGK